MTRAWRQRNRSARVASAIERQKAREARSDADQIERLKLVPGLAEREITRLQDRVAEARVEPQETRKERKQQKHRSKALDRS